MRPSYVRFPRPTVYFNYRVDTLVRVKETPHELVTLALGRLGQDREVPARLDVPTMPERVAAAHKAISGTSRLRTLRFLLDSPGSTRTQISEGSGISTTSLQPTLLELEQLGYVSANIEGPRNGHTIRYTANRAAITDDLTAFVAWTLR